MFHSFVLTRVLSCAIVLSVLFNSVLAGPACAKRQRQSADCVSKCADRWGWPGHSFGVDPWGSVMAPVPQGQNIMPTSACESGSSSSSSSSGLGQGASAPIVNPEGAPYIAPDQTQSVVSTTSIYQNISTATATTSSSSSTHHTSSHKETSTPPKPSPTTSHSSVATSSKSIPQETTTFPPSPQTTQSHEDPPQSSPISSPPQSSSPSPGTSNSDIQEYLSTHNTVRTAHGAQPLTWDDDLASKAQEWANDCVFKHSGGTLGPFGENLAAGTGSGYGIPQAVKSWTDEVSQYNPSNPVPSHFTQVVWKGSSRMGCAVSKCNGIFASSFGPANYYVCEYSPQGNVIGNFPANVQV